MKFTTTAIGLVLALGAIAPAQAKPAPAPAAASAAPCQANISKEARGAIIELQAAVNAGDKAAIAAKGGAATALAKTPDDKCLIGMLQMQAAAAASDNAALSAAMRAQLESGALPAAEQAPLYGNLGRIQFNAQDYAGATASFERAVQLAPGNGELMVMLAEARFKQGRIPESLALFEKATAGEKAAGRKPPEDWMMREVGVAFESKSPDALPLSRDWVTAYPSSKSWRDTLRILQLNTDLDDSALLDSMRLARATKALTGEADYYRYANTAILRGFPGEAAAVLNEGIAAGTISRSSPSISNALSRATAKSAGDRAALEASAKSALAAAAAKPAMGVGDAYFGYGEYAKAAALYRAALGKSGVDAKLANLRLGMALTMVGDKAAAKTALEAASPSEIAKYWLIYLSQRP